MILLAGSYAHDSSGVDSNRNTYVRLPRTKPWQHFIGDSGLPGHKVFNPFMHPPVHSYIQWQVSEAPGRLIRRADCGPAALAHCCLSFLSGCSSVCSLAEDPPVPLEMAPGGSNRGPREPQKGPERGPRGDPRGGGPKQLIAHVSYYGTCATCNCRRFVASRGLDHEEVSSESLVCECFARKSRGLPSQRARFLLTRPVRQVRNECSPRASAVREICYQRHHRRVTPRLCVRKP